MEAVGGAFPVPPPLVDPGPLVVTETGAGGLSNLRLFLAVLRINETGSGRQRIRRGVSTSIHRSREKQYVRKKK